MDGFASSFQAVLLLDENIINYSKILNYPKRAGRAEKHRAARPCIQGWSRGKIVRCSSIAPKGD
jgi:hypothetical protein